MKYFLLGLGVGILGFILFFIGGAIGGALEGFTGEKEPLLWGAYIAGAVLMGGLPVVFWVILPIIKLIRHRKY